MLSGTALQPQDDSAHSELAALTWLVQMAGGCY